MGHPAVLTVADGPVQVLDNTGLIPMELTELLEYYPSIVNLLAGAPCINQGGLEDRFFFFR